MTLALVELAPDEPLDAFLACQEELRRGDPRWIPVPRAKLRDDLSPANPWFGHGRARYFLCHDGGRPLARAAAFVDDQLLEQQDEKIGLVGLYEGVEDPEPTRVVVEAACDWLREQGMEVAWGPMSFSIWYGYRFKVEGWGRPSVLGEPENPDWYPAHFEALGFAPFKQWTAKTLDRGAIRQVADARREAHERLVGQGFRFVPFDMGRFDEQFPLLYPLLVHEFEAFTGWTDLSLEEFTFLHGRSRDLYDPSFIRFAHDPEGRLVGYALAFPDLGEPLKGLGPDASLFGKLRFLWRRRRVDGLVFMYMGMVDDARGQGLGSALTHLVYDLALRKGYQTLFHGLSATGNPTARLVGEVEGGSRYLLYRKPL